MNHRREILWLLLRLGATAFGGPAGQMALMQKEIVEKRRWVSLEDFMDGWAVSNMLPGPAATQLAIYLAYRRGGLWPAVLGGVLYVLPAFLLMCLLSWLYFLGKEISVSF